MLYEPDESLNPNHYFMKRTTDDDGVFYYKYPKAHERRVSKKKFAAIEARRHISAFDIG